MKTQTITFDVPDDILLALNESEQDLKNRVKLTLSIELFKSNKLTIGKAAQLSGMSRIQFENELSKQKVNISNLTEEDILKDLEKIK